MPKPTTIYTEGQTPWTGGASWYSTVGDGLGEAERAQQWVTIPRQAAAFDVWQSGYLYPQPDPQDRSSVDFNELAFFLSSPHEAKYGYGEGLPFTVRTVAFGAIPITARLQLEQLRDSDNLPVPLHGSFSDQFYLGLQPTTTPGVSSSEIITSVHLQGQVRLRVLSLSADGVDVGLSGTCQTDPMTLDLTGKPSWNGDPATDPRSLNPPILGAAASTWAADHGVGTNGVGGAVSGATTIPPFEGCATESGDSLAPVLTAAVSGPSVVTVGFAPLSGANYCGSAIPGLPGTNIARAPFAGDPSDCDPDALGPTLKLPARG